MMLMQRLSLPLSPRVRRTSTPAPPAPVAARVADSSTAGGSADGATRTSAPPSAATHDRTLVGHSPSAGAAVNELSFMDEMERRCADAPLDLPAYASAGSPADAPLDPPADANADAAGPTNTDDEQAGDGGQEAQPPPPARRTAAPPPDTTGPDAAIATLPAPRRRAGNVVNPSLRVRDRDHPDAPPPSGVPDPRDHRDAPPPSGAPVPPTMQEDHLDTTDQREDSNPALDYPTCQPLHHHHHHHHHHHPHGASSEQDECPICLDEYSADRPRQMTECMHHFHAACLADWRARSSTCPTCVSPLSADAPEQPGNEDSNASTAESGRSSGSQEDGEGGGGDGGGGGGGAAPTDAELSFMAVTGVAQTDAQRFMDMCEGNVAVAVTLYYATNELT